VARTLLTICVVLAVAASPATAFDEFSEENSPTHFMLRAKDLTLILKGELELELHDIEGEGGPGHDSPTDQKTLGTRSPFVEIDSLWLALRVGIGQHIGVFSVLEFRPDGAGVGAVWADARWTGPTWLEHHAEAGYHTPIVKVDRRTERYPLIATAFWREPELHLAYEARMRLARRVHLDLGASIAMMRPLALAGVQDSRSQAGTINILGSGPADTMSGNGPVGGGRLGLDVYGAFIEGFGFVGRLAAEGGTDVLRSALPNYRHLDGYHEGNAYGDFFWAGGRVGYHGHGVHAWVEGIYARQDLLERWGAYAQASWRIPLPVGGGWLPAVEPLVRVETFRILGGDDVQTSGHALRSTAPANAASWDHDALTLALITEVYRDLFRVRVEYSFLREHNGVPGLGVGDAPIRNDELVVQLELRF
jgi:hypothetical protein